MKIVSLSAVGILSLPFFCSCGGVLGQETNSTSGYIVVYRDQPTAGTNALLDSNFASIRVEVESSVVALGGEVTYSYSNAINGFAADLTQDGYDALLADDRVKYIEPDGVVRTYATQTSNLPWGLDRIDQPSGTNKKYVFSQTGNGIHAYIIDSGIRSTHAEFAGRLADGFNAVPNNAGTPKVWDDCDGHGTHVASTVGGTKFGVAKKVTLHAVRVFDCAGSALFSTVIAGVDWVAAQQKSNPKQKSVANISWGGEKSLALNQATANLFTAGVFVSVAAGDIPSGADACNYSPASADNVLTVAATNQVADQRSVDSNFGNCVKIFAPGKDILGADLKCDTCSITRSGTSMASAHVTGVAALYWEKSGGKLDNAGITSLILGNAINGIVTNAQSTSNKFLQSTPAPDNSQCQQEGQKCDKLLCNVFPGHCCCNALTCNKKKCRL